MVYLSLPIRPTETGPSMGSKSEIRLSSPEVNLLHCLEQFANHEELAQDDWAYCERTRRCERSSVKMDIWSAPECLIIHLKRFAVDATTGAGAKRGGELLTTTKRSGKTNCQRKSAKISNCKTMNWEIQKGVDLRLKTFWRWGRLPTIWIHCSPFSKMKTKENTQKNGKTNDVFLSPCLSD